MSSSLRLMTLAILVVALLPFIECLMIHPARQEKAPASIDCGPAGVFDNSAPFDTLPLPQCPDSLALNVVLRLYTRDDPIVGRVITRTTRPNTFSNSRQTWFISHGYLTEESRSWIADMILAALQQGDYNVIGIEWNSFEANYLQSASDTRTVGAEVALIARDNLVAFGLPRENLYCIGHSLGSHVCSFAGKAYKFPRITGLDPAGPWFDWYLLRLSPVALEPNDADKVDVIHTDTIVLGTDLNRGHADFYPSVIPLVGHGFAIDLFSSSIRQPKDCFLADLKFSSSQCLMGFYANECQLRGEFYIVISPLPPFCRL